MKVQLLSTKTGMKSASLKRLALALSQALGYKVFRVTAVKRPNRRILKYGQAVDKLQQYQWFKEQGISALEFTTDIEIARDWLQGQGNVVFGRKLLNASCGDGIVVFDPKTPHDAEDITPCPVYTKYKKKKREFRVHVFQDKVIAIVEKKRRKEWDGQSDSKIRNLANGYVFCQDIELEPAFAERIRELALKASKVCASDFKGVDLAYNEKHDDLFVIEVNSAPGIEGSNVQKYVNQILESN
jgi:hypothetical protein